MSDNYEGGSPLVRNILIGAAVVWLVGSVIFMVMANNRINDMEQRQTAALKEMSKKMDDSNGQMRASISVVAETTPRPGSRATKTRPSSSSQP